MLRVIIHKIDGDNGYAAISRQEPWFCFVDDNVEVLFTKVAKAMDFFSDGGPNEIAYEHSKKVLRWIDLGKVKK